MRDQNDLHERGGLLAATKITRRHVNYDREKMKVRFAAQLLSDSAADAIDTCREDWKMKQFVGSEATSYFIRAANVAFDILNSSNHNESSPLKKPLNGENMCCSGED